MNKSIDHITSDVVDVLKGYYWPGNIRELQNFIERSVLASEDRIFSPRITELKALIHSAPPQTLFDAERAHIIGILKAANWVVCVHNGAAARLGLPRTTLIIRVQKLGISNNLSGLHRASFKVASAFPNSCEPHLALTY